MIRNKTSEVSFVHFALLQKAETFDIANSTYVHHIQQK